MSYVCICDLLVATSTERQHLKFPSEFAIDLLTLNLVSTRSPVPFVVSSEITENDVYLVGFCLTKLNNISYQESGSSLSIHSLILELRPHVHVIIHSFGEILLRTAL